MRRGVHRQHARGAQPAGQTHRQGQVQVGVGIPGTTDRHRGQAPDDGGGGLHRQAGIPTHEGDHHAVIEPHGHAGHRHGQVLQTSATERLAHQLRHACTAQPLGSAQVQAQQVPGLDGQGQFLDPARVQARGAQRAGQGAH